ncbi:MAG: hypothetical protein EPO35_12475 [Acidobacteria bacterium]|nr:MAG: hypothetical protein EPO35_12475 [Acidobacteriota bacterium]
MIIRPDFLPRLERRALLLAAVLAAAALIWPSGGANVAAGVFGGALLSGVSYWSIKRGVDGLTGAMAGGASARARLARALTILVGRYALLALIAYVMISRLRLSPLGLLVGVSVIPLAATIEVLAGRRKHGQV